jgi:tetratricopeptide (TPR) repeat protein
VSRTLDSPSQQIRLELVESVAVRNLGDAKRAGELAQQAVDEARAHKMDNVATSGLIDLGNTFLMRGDWKPAEQYYRSALDFARRNKGRRNEARAQSSLGSLFEQKNRPDDAQPLIEAALPFYRQAGYRRELVQATVLLGSVYAQRAEFEAGARILRDALAGAIQLQDRQVEVQVRGRLGEFLRDQGVWPEALAEYERSVELLGPGILRQDASVTRAQLYWWLGRRQEAEESLSEVERFLSRGSSQTSAYANFKLIRSEMAYDQGRLGEAATIAGQVSSLSNGSGGPAESQAALIQALVLIRTGHGNEGLDTATNLIQQLDRGKLNARAAAARLATAGALSAAGNRGSALQFARQALSFFEPRRIWESVWRSHALAAGAAQEPAEIETHRTAARSALDQLKQVWPAQTVGTYLKRPDIERLFTTVR